MRKTWITAHSGAENTPDNSLEFVAYALQTDADVLELDIRRRSEEDPTLVLSHDETEENVPLLEEAFRMIAVHPTMCINCDLKESGLEHAVLSLAQKCGLLPRILFSGTVNPDCIACEDRDIVLMNAEELVENFYERCETTPEEIEPMIEELCVKCNALDIRTVNLYEGIVSDGVLGILNRHNIKLSVWTVNEPQRQQYFLTNQVMNLTTRRVQSALHIREEVYKNAAV